MYTQKEATSSQRGQDLGWARERQMWPNLSRDSVIFTFAVTPCYAHFPDEHTEAQSRESPC